MNETASLLIALQPVN